MTSYQDFQIKRKTLGEPVAHRYTAHLILAPRNLEMSVEETELMYTPLMAPHPNSLLDRCLVALREHDPSEVELLCRVTDYDVKKSPRKYVPFFENTPPKDEFCIWGIVQSVLYYDLPWWPAWVELNETKSQVEVIFTARTQAAKIETLLKYQTPRMHGRVWGSNRIGFDFE
jgi:hypothetical protein